MIRNTENTAKTTRKTPLLTKARKLLLGIGGIAVAGCMMAASPAQARDRFVDHGRGFERHDERRDDRHDERRDERNEFRQDVVVRRDFIAPVVCDPIAPPVEQVWVPDRYEFQTHWIHGREFTERVCVEAGHWVCR